MPPPFALDVLPSCVPPGAHSAEAHEAQRDSDEVLRKCSLPATEPLMVLLHASHIGLDLPSSPVS